MSEGTSISYGSLTLSDVLTKDFRHSCVYDDSNTDLLYHNMSVTVETLVSEDGIHIGLPLVGSIENKIAKIREALHPRQDFSMHFGNQEVLKASPDPELDHRDVNNGPKIRDVDVVHVAGFKAIRIRFSIDVARVYCGAAGSFNESYQVQQNADVLNNRWSIQETRNGDFYMTRRITGSLRVAHSSIWPHLMRHLVMPPLVRGYKRESMDFIQSRDGLKLDYTIVDQQRYLAPPRPAVEWISPVHRETTTNSGAKGFASIQIGLKGSPGTPKGELLAACARVVENRLGDLRRINDENSGAWITGASIVDYIDQHSVSLNVDVIRTKVGAKYFGTLFEKLGHAPGSADGDPDREDEEYNVDEWPNPIPYDGSTPAGIFATYLQTPCNSYHGMPYIHPGSPENELPPFDQDENSPTVRAYAGESKFNSSDIGDQGTRVSEEQNTFPYVDIELESKYINDHGMIIVPISSTPPSAEPGGGVDPTLPNAFIAQLHRPIARQTILLKARRVGMQPLIPNFLTYFQDANSIGMYLESHEIVPMPPKLMPAGDEYLYEVHLHISYAMERAPLPNEILRVGSLPWDTTSFTENQYQQSENGGDII